MTTSPLSIRLNIKCKLSSRCLKICWLFVYDYKLATYILRILYSLIQIFARTIAHCLKVHPNSWIPYVLKIQNPVSRSVRIRQRYFEPFPKYLIAALKAKSSNFQDVVSWPGPSTSWKFITSADHQAPLQTYWIKYSEDGIPQCFHKLFK